MLGRKQNKRYKTYYNVTLRYIQTSASWTLVFHTVISLNPLGSHLLLFTHVYYRLLLNLLVIHNLRISPHQNSSTADLQTILHTQFLGIIIIHLHTKFNVPRYKQQKLHITTACRNKTHNACVTVTQVHSHHRRCGKSISITYSECVSVALVIQHALCIHCIILSSVTTFFHILINSTVFGKELLDIKCAL